MFRIITSASFKKLVGVLLGTLFQAYSYERRTKWANRVGLHWHAACAWRWTYLCSISKGRIVSHNRHATPFSSCCGRPNMPYHDPSWMPLSVRHLEVHGQCWLVALHCIVLRVIQTNVSTYRRYRSWHLETWLLLQHLSNFRSHFGPQHCSTHVLTHSRVHHERNLDRVYHEQHRHFVRRCLQCTTFDDTLLKANNTFNNELIHPDRSTNCAGVCSRRCVVSTIIWS